MTIGELYGPAMGLTDQAAADAYLAGLVGWHLRERPQDPRDEAERVQRANLAYYAGYYDHDTRRRVERLFACAHPVFGPAGEAPPDPAAAVRMGMAAAKNNSTGGHRR